MHVEVDQSGKIGSKGPTVLALSNKISFVILIPANIKRELVRILRSEGKTGKTFYLQLFAVGLFLLLKDHILKVSLVTIDPEYQSKDNDIKAILLNLFRRDGLSVDPEKIRFQRVTKKSPAHLKANNCLEGEIEPDRKISVEEILSQFKTNGIGVPKKG